MPIARTIWVCPECVRPARHGRVTWLRWAWQPRSAAMPFHRACARFVAREWGGIVLRGRARVRGTD